MTAVRMWVRLDLARRWQSLIVLALLVALASGTIMATLAGARRGASALDRLEQGTLPTTATVLANAPGFDWDAVRALPQVQSLTTFAVDYAITAQGRPGDVLVPPETLGFPLGDDNMMRTIEKPVVLAGRPLNPARADEAVVTRLFVKKHHLGVGDYVTVHLPTMAELDSTATGGDVFDPHGPAVRTRIVGVVVSPGLLDRPGSTGFLITSPGLGARYPLNVFGDPKDLDNPNFTNALVRLRGGEAAIPAFQMKLQDVSGRYDIELQDNVAQMRELQRHVAFESQCLVAFAIAVFVAALFLIGQALVRYTAGSAIELRTLRALGMTPRQAVLTAITGPVLLSTAGVLCGAITAGIATRWFPYGTAGLIEPDPGLRIDWLVLPAVGIAAVLLVLAAATASAVLAFGAGRADRASRPSGLATAVRRAGFGVPVVIGTRFALEPGRGRTSVPVRPALLGAVTGVLGVVAAFTFSHGVSDAADHPARYGQTFQLNAFVGFAGQSFVPQPKVRDAIAADPRVTGVDDARTAVATGPSRTGSVSLWEFQSGPKAIPIVLTAGRLPDAADEVVLAPRSVTALHAKLGERVYLIGNWGEGAYTVTGVGLVPIGPHNTYSDGGWVTPAGFDSLFRDFKFQIELVSLKHGTDVDAMAKSLSADVAKAVPGAKVEFDRNAPPTELAEIRQVRVLPIALGLFLALLAIGAVGHALATAVRRRQVDIAVLRALGMTRWQSRAVVVVQASVLAVFGLVFGIPLGFALGRVVWQVVANYTPLKYIPPLALWTMILVVPLALLVANLLAAWPGYRAAKMRVAHVLRAE